MTLFDWLNQILYRKLIPRQKRFLKYIKGKKDKYSKSLLKFLAEHYKVSQREIVEYMPMINKKHIEELAVLYGKNKKQIKEMMK